MFRKFAPSLACLRLPILCAALALAGCGEAVPQSEPPLQPDIADAVGEQPGVDRERLARAIQALFTDEGVGETYALVIMHEGERVAELYGEGLGPETRFSGWSMSKTVTATLVGMMVADGRIALDDPAPVPRWQRAGDPRGEITLRHLLQMRAGLRHEEKADPPYESAEVRMMFLDGRDDMAGWAEAQPLEHEPGSTFDYSTPTAIILADIGARLLAPGGAPTERQAAMAEFLQARLAGPLGLESMAAEFDASGTMNGGSSIWASARDWAAFGEFLRRGGSVDGAQIVPRGWVQFMKTASPAAPDYGGQLWLNRDSGAERQLLFPAQGPESLFAAIGHLGQYILVAPEQRLTLVRLGKTDQEDRDALVERLAAIVALYER